MISTGLGDRFSASCKAAQQICYGHGVVPASTLSEETETRLETDKRTHRGVKGWCKEKERTKKKKSFFLFAVGAKSSHTELLLIILLETLRIKQCVVSKHYSGVLSRS